MPVCQMVFDYLSLKCPVSLLRHHFHLIIPRYHTLWTCSNKFILFFHLLDFKKVSSLCPLAEERDSTRSISQCPVQTRHVQCCQCALNTYNSMQKNVIFYNTETVFTMLICHFFTVDDKLVGKLNISANLMKNCFPKISISTFNN